MGGRAGGAFPGPECDATWPGREAHERFRNAVAICAEANGALPGPPVEWHPDQGLIVSLPLQRVGPDADDKRRLLAPGGVSFSSRDAWWRQRAPAAVRGCRRRAP